MGKEREENEKTNTAASRLIGARHGFFGAVGTSARGSLTKGVFRFKQLSDLIAEDRRKHSISGKVLRDYRRPDAFRLWKELVRDNPHFSRQTMSHIRFFP